MPCAVAGPIPGKATSSFVPAGNTPSYPRTISSAAALSARARRLYPIPCQAARTSAVPASASAKTLGNASSHSAHRVSTRATCVCCSMTSESQILYGSRVRRHGRSRYKRTPSVRTSVRKGSMFILSSLEDHAATRTSTPWSTRRTRENASDRRTWGRPRDAAVD